MKKAGVAIPSNPKSQGKKDSCLNEIQRLQRERDERRKATENARIEKASEEQRNRENGNFGDVDFQRMIIKYREENGTRARAHAPPGDMKICIAVRKRPINMKEVKKKDYDSVTCQNPVVVVHDCKLKVDGITKVSDLFILDDFYYTYATVVVIFSFYIFYLFIIF